jgi:hypothetical protein
VCPARESPKIETCWLKTGPQAGLDVFGEGSFWNGDSYEGLTLGDAQSG